MFRFFTANQDMNQSASAACAEDAFSCTCNMLTVDAIVVASIIILLGLILNIRLITMISVLGLTASRLAKYRSC